MKRLAAIVVFLSVVAIAGYILAADEAAKKDANRVPTMIGLTSGNEIRNLEVDSDGKLNVNTVAAVTSITDIAGGHIQIWDGATSTQVLDGTNNKALYIALTDGTDTAAIDGSGNVAVTGTVTVSRTTAYQYSNSNISVATATVVAPTTPSSNFVVSVFNGGAGAIFVVLCDDAVCSGETPAAANVGLEIPSGTGKSWENVTVAGLSVFNEGLAAADISVEWRR
jgi:hypothetical protein